MVPYLLIGLGGLLGANARYLLSLWAANRFGMSFPYGTFLINASGSFLIGVALTVIGQRFDDSANARFLLTTGFLGAYTTFSTFAFETVALYRQGDLRPALINALGSVAAGVIGVTGGMLLATTLGAWFA